MSEGKEADVSLTDTQDPRALLKSYLSTTAYLSPASTTLIAQEYPHTSDTSHLSKHYESIGHGQCAEIFGQSSKVALKKAHPPQKKHAEVVNDSVQHQKVCTAFEKYAQLCHVPEYQSLILPSNDEWYASYGTSIPNSKLLRAKGSRERTPILAIERILPLPGVVRDAIIEQFCPKGLKGVAREDEENRDCLLRLYLGTGLPIVGPTPSLSASPNVQFSLRNFPLCLNKTESLGLDAKPYAEAIAEGIAILHWGAGIDARDVEFVLGSSKLLGKDQYGNQDGEMEVETRKGNTVWVWVLDFNQCEGIERDESGVELAARAWWDNDPYFPRAGAACGKDEELWECFRGKYEEVGRMILDGESEEVRGLPGRVLERVVEMGKVRGMGGGGSGGPPRGGIVRKKKERV